VSFMEQSRRFITLKIINTRDRAINALNGTARYLWRQHLRDYDTLEIIWQAKREVRLESAWLLDLDTDCNGIPFRKRTPHIYG
jgi:hypothetical protein